MGSENSSENSKIESRVAPRILLVLSPDRRSRLLPLLEGRGWDVEFVAGFQDGVRRLSASADYDLIMVDAELPDGTWRNLILFLQNAGKTTEMIVCARLGDHQLWAEVLQCGAYDLISEPSHADDITRVVESALDSQYMRRFTSANQMRLTMRV
ncbi:MAG: hypothetical protein HYX72_04740 [Acidobacteria bacterium]|nr:hypothetical protein [Acidobacteriota bacterium]